MRSQSAIAEPALPACADAGQIRAHLKRVLSSPQFAASTRLTQFLSFVVETTLAGQGHELKESLIAVEVYGRRPDYNPQIDSTVRVEAGRLRARLRQYYDGAHGSDGVRIELPRGGYVPLFVMVPPSDAAVAEVPVAESGFAWRRCLGIPAALLCGVCALLAWTRISARTNSPMQSVAVLPFVCPGGEDSFCHGLTDEVSVSLGRGGARVRVAAGSTMAQQTHSAADVRNPGREHMVRAVLQGTVRRDGVRMVLTANLTDTRDGYQMWADRYESDDAHATTAQRKFSAGIAAGVTRALTGNTRTEPDDRTMDLYHRAMELLRIPVMKNGIPEKMPESVVESVRLFREVTARCPQFGGGWAGLAEATEWQYELGGNTRADLLAGTEAAAHKAVEVAPELVDGWKVLTSILFYRKWDLQGAEAACRRALELDPRDVAIRQRYIDILRVLRRSERAQSAVDEAIRIQPAAAPFRIRRALLLYEAGIYDEALREAQAASELTNQIPAYPMTLWVQGLCLEQKGQLAEAERMFRSALQVQQHDPWSEPALGHLLGRMHRRSEAEAILQELTRQHARGRMTHVEQALVHAGLGRAEEAVACLERAWTERDDSLLSIPMEPRFRTLASDARFRSLLARLKDIAGARS